MTGLLVAIAGGLGAVARFLVDAWVSTRLRRPGSAPAMPMGTLLINVTGSFVLGLVTGWWVAHGGDPALRAALGTGFCGGYTTFSTASVEAARLMLAGRGWTAVIHAGGMLVLGLAAAAAGIWLGGLG